MVKNEMNADRFFVVIFVLVYRRVVPIFIGGRLHISAQADIVPTSGLSDGSMLRGERDGAATNKFIDVPNVSAVTPFGVNG